MSDQELLALVEAKNEHIEVLEQRIRDIKLAFNESHEKGFREPLTYEDINRISKETGAEHNVCNNYWPHRFAVAIQRTLATRWGVKLKGDT